MNNQPNESFGDRSERIAITYQLIDERRKKCQATLKAGLEKQSTFRQMARAILLRMDRLHTEIDMTKKDWKIS